MNLDGPALYVVDVVVIALVAWGLIALMRANRRRRRSAARSWSADNGMQYQAVDPGLAIVYPGDPFDTGIYRNVENVVTGTFAGRPVRTFDLRITFTTWVPSLRLTRGIVNVVSMQLPAVLPTVKVCPMSVLRRRQDGGLERVPTGDQRFDEAYWVFTDDVSFAHDVLDPALREWLLSVDARAWLIQGNEVVTWRWSRGTTGTGPERAMVMAPFLQAVADRIPAGVWQRAGVRSTTG